MWSFTVCVLLSDQLVDELSFLKDLVWTKLINPSYYSKTPISVLLHIETVDNHVAYSSCLQVAGSL
jgi:hypothetical protein